MAKFKFNILTGLFDLVEDLTTLGLSTSDSPTFATVKLTDLTDGYIPYHVNDAAGLADGPTKTNVDSAVSLKHAMGSDFLVMQVFS